MTKLDDRELANRSLIYEELVKSEGWKLLRDRFEELESDLYRQLGQRLVRVSRPDSSGTIGFDQMLTAFVDIAEKRGIVKGMRLIVNEPDRIDDYFDKAFREKIDG